MNIAATHLLRSLDVLGLHSVSFRILGLGPSLRHTAPVALSVEEEKCRVNFSVGDLFAAYAIAPRKGTYELYVGDGRLAFEPAPRLTLLKKRAVKAKAAARGFRAAQAGVHHKLAA